MFEGKELIRESEWLRVYRVGKNHLHYESKFLTENLEVAAESLASRWPRLAEEEHLEFANAFAAKADFSQNDELILSFLMREGTEVIWSNIAVRLAEHSDREAVLKFLLERIKPSRPYSTSYFQALEVLGDKRAVFSLRNSFDEYQQELGLGTPPRLLTDVYGYLDYLSLCHALLTLDGGDEYRAAIRSMLDHSDERVRFFARKSLS